MSEKDNDIDIAKWLAEQKSRKELEESEEPAHVDLYEKIISEVDQWSLPDIEKDQGFVKLKGRLDNRSKKKTKIVSFSMVWAAGIAAAIAFVVVSYVFFFTPSRATYQTAYGETKAVELPDGSKAILNTNSSLAYDKEQWDNDPKVLITGEVYFFGDHAKNFSAVSEMGRITVLGTRFSVRQLGEYLTVKCLEGSVRVQIDSGPGESTVLGSQKKLAYSEGMGMMVEDIEVTQPIWIEGNETKFKNAALGEVFEALKAQFGVELTYSPKCDLKRKFSGSFLHTNVEIALRMVCEPLDLKYKKLRDNKYKIL